MNETSEVRDDVGGGLSPVGFFGLGRMGFPMARHLTTAGFEVLGFDIDSKARARFAAEIAAPVKLMPADIAARARVVITMLPTSTIVRDVLVGDHGIARHCQAGTIVVDMSTSDPTDTRRLGQELAEHGIELVDAPVAGGVIFAEDGTLDILTGGRAEAVERLAPMFAAVGRSTFYCGALGAAHAMKAINNYVNAAVMSVYMEALVVGKRFGIEEGVMREAIEASTLGRNHPYDKKIRTQVFTRAFDSRMALGLIAKDLGIAANIARSIDLEAPLSDAVSALWERASDEVGFGADQTELVRFWENRAGVALGDETD